MVRYSYSQGSSSLRNELSYPHLGLLLGCDIEEQDLRCFGRSLVFFGEKGIA